MKKYLIVSALAALSACGSPDAPVEGGPSQEAATDPPLAADESAAAEIAGVYEVTAEDGSIVRQTVGADGSYVETIDGTEIERGTWHQKGGQMCYNPESDAKEQCYTGGSPGSHGSFSVEMDSGTANVRRVDEADIAKPAAARAGTE